MTVVGPTVPINTDENGVLSAVFDPVNNALRVSSNAGGGGGGGTGPTASYTLVQSANLTLCQVRGDYPTNTTLTELRFQTARWPQIELASLNAEGFHKYYAMLSARIGVTDAVTPRTFYAGMFQSVDTATASGIGWTPTTPVWTIVTTGAILTSQEFAGVIVRETPLMECDIFTANPTLTGKVGWIVWTDDPLQGFVDGRISVFGK